MQEESLENNNSLETSEKTADPVVDEKGEEPKPKGEISPKIIDELVEMSKASDGKLKREDFFSFLQENDLMGKKKEILTYLGSRNVC